jgi:hypothetical protein
MPFMRARQLRIGQVAAPLEMAPGSGKISNMSRRRTRGQVAVETALVLPVFVFLILGLLQMGLMSHARVLTKYAAFKAVRAGAVNGGDVAMMENAALGVLLPVLGRRGTAGAPYKTDSIMAYNTAWNAMSNNNQIGGLKFAEVVVCAPSRSQVNAAGDFDDPRVAIGDGNVRSGVSNQTVDDWPGFNNTKLQIQVTTYYRMFIPFANWMVWRIAANKEDGSPQKMRTLGWKAGSTSSTGKAFQSLAQYASQKVYITPIRASYAMRMQSNFRQAAAQALPNAGRGTNPDCKKTWN